MKEMIIIEKELLEKIIKASPIQWFDNKEKIDNVILFGKEYKTEKYPTNWEELKELCKDVDGCKIEKDYIEIIGCLVGSNILFCKDGAIMLNTDCCFAVKVSYDRMWQIIKNLIGE